MTTQSDRILAAVEAAEHGSEAFALPKTRLSIALDGFITVVGKAVSWLWPILILVIIANVVLRYVFNLGLIVFEELQWHIYAIGFMIGLSFAVVRDRHVRVDALSERMSVRTRAWIELIGLGVFLLPFCVFVVIKAWPFVLTAWETGEVSIAPGGLGHRWAIKSVIIVAFALLIVAAVSRISRVTALLFGFPKSLPYEDRGDTAS